MTSKWIKEIKKYLKNDECDEYIIKLSLSYTLQSLRANEDIFNKFKWERDVNNCFEKRFIQVWLDLKNQNGCWNCKNDWSICTVNHIGTVGYIRGVSHCALKDWEYDKEKHKKRKFKY